MPRKSHFDKWLGAEFPGFPARFPGAGWKSADFGRNLQNFAAWKEKFAAKFPEAGNLEAAEVVTRTFSLRFVELNESG